MTPDDQLIKELADEHGVGAEALRRLLTSLRERAGADSFYIFWTIGKGAKPAGARRQRTLLAFLTPDTALAFAQHNQLGIMDQPRLRRLSMLQIVHAALREPGITAILFVADHGDHSPLAGRLPPGIRIERADLIRSLHAD